jgi:hypothetical protein
MNRKPQVLATGLVVAAALGALSACSGSTSTVKGDRDDLRHHAAIWGTHLVNTTRQQCTPKTTTQRVGKNTTTSTTNSCKTVVTGTHSEQYQQIAPRWCVELDNVGKTKQDDVWYTVTSGTYYKATNKHKGDHIKLSYQHRGC